MNFFIHIGPALAKVAKEVAKLKWVTGVKMPYGLGVPWAMTKPNGSFDLSPITAIIEEYGEAGVPIIQWNLWMHETGRGKPWKDRVSMAAAFAAAVARELPVCCTIGIEPEFTQFLQAPGPEELILEAEAVTKAIRSANCKLPIMPPALFLPECHDGPSKAVLSQRLTDDPKAPDYRWPWAWIREVLGSSVWQGNQLDVHCLTSDKEIPVICELADDYDWRAVPTDVTAANPKTGFGPLGSMLFDPPPGYTVAKAIAEIETMKRAGWKPLDAEMAVQVKLKLSRFQEADVGSVSFSNLGDLYPRESYQNLMMREGGTAYVQGFGQFRRLSKTSGSPLPAPFSDLNKQRELVRWRPVVQAVTEWSEANT